jgi:membrane associated rhomboid family serine protease
MLENRDYMRGKPDPGSPFRLRWNASTLLMVSLVILYALQCVNDVYIHSPAELWLGLSAQGLASGYLWQLVTFQFLHGSFWHLFGNLLGLFFFGRFVESIMGTRRFLVAYFFAGIIGGILQGILMLTFPMHYGLLLFGASAGISGLFAIFAMVERQTEVYVYFILPVRALTLLYVFVAISLFFTIVPSSRDHTAHAAHLGGLVAGILWVKLGWHHDYVRLPWEGLLDRWRRWRPSLSRERKRALVRAASVKSDSWKRPETDAPEEVPTAEFISKEVDPILDKISKQGIHTLTERERKILDAARKKISR